jgi:RNA polymerase sigma factor (sigma-70 family)
VSEVTGRATQPALARIYERRYAHFLRVAEAIVGDAELARDVVQEAFARMIRSRFEFRGEGALEGWVWRTLVNTARNARRDRPPLTVSLADADDVASSNGHAPDERVRALMVALPERQRPRALPSLLR